MILLKKILEKIIKFKIEIIVFTGYFLYLIIIRIITPIFGSGGYINLGEGDLDWDFYIRMSRDIPSIFKKEIIAPFCHRPLMPFLAGLLPFSLQINYALLVFISVYLTGIMLYFTLRMFFNKILSVIGLIIFCYLNYMILIYQHITLSDYGFFLIYFHEIYNVDSLALLFIMLCFYCILSGKKKGYLIFLVLGILTKESVIFTISVFLLYTFLMRDKLENKKVMLYKYFKNLLYIGPGILVYVLIRIIVQPDSLSNWPRWYVFYGNSEYFSIEMIIRFIKIRYEGFLKRDGLYYWTVGTWGLSLTILISLNTGKKILNWLKLYGLYMVLVYSQMFLAIATTKFFYYGFFPMIFLALSGLNSMNEDFTNESTLNLLEGIKLTQ